MLCILPAMCPMRKSKTIAYKIPYKVLLLYILQSFHIDNPRLQKTPYIPFTNLVEYPVAYTIRYRILSIIQLLRLCLCLVPSFIQRLMEFPIEYPKEIRYIMPFIGLIEYHLQYRTDQFTEYPLSMIPSEYPIGSPQENPMECSLKYPQNAPQTAVQNILQITDS